MTVSPKLKRYLLLAGVAAGLAGCTTNSIIMKDPKTGERAECGRHNEFWALDVFINALREQSCVSDFQDQGWVRAGNY